MIRLAMKNKNTILIGTVSALSSGKIDKCEYATGEEILLSNQSF